MLMNHFSNLRMRGTSIRDSRRHYCYHEKTIFVISILLCQFMCFTSGVVLSEAERNSRRKAYFKENMSTALAFKDGMIVSNQSLFAPSGNCALWIFSENSGMTPWIFVSDSNNHVVQVFDAHTGTNLRQIGTGKKGLAAGKLNSPRGLVLRVADIVSGFPTILFVSEFFNHRVQIFDAYLGNHERFIGGKRGSLEASVLNGPTGIALVESPPGAGRPALLYVADFWNSRVAVFDADTGDYSHQIGVGEVGPPWGLTLRNTLANTGQSPMLYVADFSNRQVLVFDAGSDDRLNSIGSITECNESENECGGDTPGELTEPAAVALLESLPGSDQPTLLYVADSARNEISVFDADNGQFIRLLGGGAGSAAGQLNQPSGLILHLGSDGNRTFFVTESGNRRVQILTEAAISSSYKRSDDLLTFVDIQDIKINSKKELEERLRIEAEDNARWDEEERVRKDAKEQIKKEARRAAKSKAKQEVRRKKLERLEEQATCGLSSATLRMDDNDVNRNLKNLLSEHFFFFGAYRRCKLADTTAATPPNEPMECIPPIMLSLDRLTAGSPFQHLVFSLCHTRCKHFRHNQKQLNGVSGFHNATVSTLSQWDQLRTEIGDDTEERLARYGSLAIEWMARGDPQGNQGGTRDARTLFLAAGAEQLLLKMKLDTSKSVRKHIDYALNELLK